MDVSRVLLCVCVVIFTVLAAVCDIRTKKIPNVLTVSALVAALLFHLVNGVIQGGLSGAGKGLLVALGGFATGFGILFVLWLIGGGGGGDVKLMGALGAWLGPASTLFVFLLSAVLVSMGTLGVLAWHACRYGFRQTKKRFFGPGRDSPQGSAKASGKRGARRRIMPLGVPVALATWFVLAFPHLKEIIKVQG